MRTIGTILLGGMLVGLAGAAPADPPSDNVTKLRAEVESLRRRNAELERKLAEANARIRVLPPDLWSPRDSTRPSVVPRPFDTVPIPPDAKRRGEGNVWHYVIPVEDPRR